MLSKKLIFLSLLVITGVLANTLYFENYGIDGANLVPSNLQFAGEGCSSPNGLTIAGTTTLTTMENGSTTITTTSLDGTFLIITQLIDGTVITTYTTLDGTAVTTTKTPTGKVITTTTKISSIKIKSSGEVEIIPEQDGGVPGGDGGLPGGDAGGDGPSGTIGAKGKDTGSPIYFESIPTFPVGTQLPCGITIGECGGEITCQADGTWTECSATQPGNIKEKCGDGKDNDCDGTIDEDCVCLDGETRECGSNSGVCIYGKETCNSGVWGACAGGIIQTRETCENGLDDDCDGIVDNSCVCVSGETKTCGTNIGVCTSGIQTCVNEVWTVCKGAVEPRPESCLNTLDDDCDGETNNGCKEICDGIDNDADGTVDEGCPVKCELTNIEGKQHCCQQVNTAGDFIYDQGHCSPTLKDVSGDVFLLIGGSDYLPAEIACEEKCGDGKDNDCDGEIDEGCEAAEKENVFEVYPKSLNINLEKGEEKTFRFRMYRISGTICPKITPSDASVITADYDSSCFSKGFREIEITVKAPMLAGSHSYKFTVEGSGDEEIPINIDVAKCAENTQPTAPEGLTAVAGEYPYVYLKWQESTDPDDDFITYNVHWCAAADCSVVITSLTETYYLHDVSETYDSREELCDAGVIYNVHAHDGCAIPVASELVDLDCEGTAPPSPPRNLEALGYCKDDGGGGIALNWNPPILPYVTVVEEYRIYRGVEPIFDEMTHIDTMIYINETLTDVISYHDSTCMQGEVYYYAVTVLGGENQESNPSNIAAAECVCAEQQQLIIINTIPVDKQFDVCLEDGKVTGKVVINTTTGIENAFVTLSIMSSTPSMIPPLSTDYTDEFGNFELDVCSFGDEYLDYITEIIATKEGYQDGSLSLTWTMLPNFAEECPLPSCGFMETAEILIKIEPEEFCIPIYLGESASDEFTVTNITYETITVTTGQGCTSGELMFSFGPSLETLEPDYGYVVGFDTGIVSNPVYLGIHVCSYLIKNDELGINIDVPATIEVLEEGQEPEHCVDESPPLLGELCDGIDNDWDGFIDNAILLQEFPKLTQPCEGECGWGEQTCLFEEYPPEGWSECSAGEPETEVCNNHDDDCDDLIDEDIAPQQCGTDVGACEFGQSICTAGEWGSCAGGITPEIEICGDFIDNDCDGFTDEGCGCIDGDKLICGSDVGTCESGMQTCYNSSWGSCVGSVGPINEICDDGLDNDCDGSIDEGCGCVSGTSRTCGSAVGICEMGVQYCVNSVWESCSTLSLAGQEICGNGLDDDCDGQTDEGCDLQIIAGLGSGIGTGGADGLKIEALDPVSVGDLQTIYVVDSETEEPVETATVTVVTPSGSILTNVTDSAGKISFQVAEAGTHEVSAVKDAKSATASFKALDAISSLLASAGSLGDWLFGESFSDAPWIYILLLVLAIIAAVIAYYVSDDYFSKGAKPFSQRRLEKIARIAIAAIFLILPLVVNLITSVEIAIAFTFIEVASLFILEYHKNGWDRIKRIPTIFVAKPTLRETQPGLVGKIK